MISIILIVLVIMFLFFVITKNRKKYVFIGLGTSGLNVTKSWIQKGGKGFALMDKKYQKEKINQYDTISEILSQISKRRKYIIVSGLGGKTSKKMLMSLIQNLDEKEIQFKILAYLPFKLEGSIRNDQALQIHSKLMLRSNYNFIEIERELEQQPNKELPVLFKKMNELGLEMII